MSGSDNLRLIDRRVRMGLKGMERPRAVVDSVHGRTAMVRFGNALLPAIVPALEVTLVAGMTVELERPRGVGGQLQIARVLGVSGPAETAATVLAAQGIVPVVTVLPTATAALRGHMLLLDGGVGVADTLWQVRKDAAEVYAWVAV